MDIVLYINHLESTYFKKTTFVGGEETKLLFIHLLLFTVLLLKSLPFEASLVTLNRSVPGVERI